MLQNLTAVLNSLERGSSGEAERLLQSVTEPDLKAYLKEHSEHLAEGLHERAGHGVAAWMRWWAKLHAVWKLLSVFLVLLAPALAVYCLNNVATAPPRLQRLCLALWLMCAVLFSAAWLQGGCAVSPLLLIQTALLGAAEDDASAKR
jgi:hypothetical protein